MASNPIDDIRELMDRLNAMPQTQVLNEKFGDSIRSAFGDKEAKGRQAADDAYQTFWDGWVEWKGASGAKGTVTDMVQFLHTPWWFSCSTHSYDHGSKRPIGRTTTPSSC